MFFVISGYCLTACAVNAIAANQSVGEFVRRRLRRIYPPYWFSILLAILLPYVLAACVSLKHQQWKSPLERGVTGLSLIDWLGYVTLLRVFLPREGFLHLRFSEINIVYWSLAIEVQFYSMVAIALAKRTQFFTILLLMTIMSIPCVWSGWLQNSGIFLPFWIQFAFGVGLYYSLYKGITPCYVFGRLATCVSLLSIGVISIIIVAAMFDCVAMSLLSPFSFAGLFALSLWLGHNLDAALDLQLSLDHRLRALLRIPFTVGAISYSLYLIHIPVYKFLANVWTRFAPVDSVVARFFIAIATIAISYLFYRLCELPFIHIKPLNSCASAVTDDGFRSPMCSSRTVEP